MQKYRVHFKANEEIHIRDIYLSREASCKTLEERLISEIRQLDSNFLDAGIELYNYYISI